MTAAMASEMRDGAHEGPPSAPVGLTALLQRAASARPDVPFDSDTILQYHKGRITYGMLLDDEGQAP